MDDNGINRVDGDMITNKGSLKRLNPYFGNIGYAYSGGNSVGHYGSAVATRRFSHGFALRGIYTYGKALDYTSNSDSLDAGSITTGTGVIQSQNLKAQRGRADFSLKQQFTADGTWITPATCKTVDVPFFFNEKIKIEGKGEVTNLFNRVNFTGVHSDMNGGQFGQYSGQLSPRNLQFHLRASFWWMSLNLPVRIAIAILTGLFWTQTHSRRFCRSNHESTRNVRQRKVCVPTMSRAEYAADPVRSMCRAVVGFLLAILVLAPTVSAQMAGQSIAKQPPVKALQAAYGLHATVGNEVVEITVCGDSSIHVVARPDAAVLPTAQRPWMLDARQSCPGAPFTFAQDAKTATIKTAKLAVSFGLERGNVSFASSSGEQLLNEGSSVPRTYEPVELNGDKTYRVTDRFQPTAMEALYGLGQHQSGMFNYRGGTVELAQNNTDVAIPLLVSSKGYALMWNTAALTYFDNRFPLEVTLSSIAGGSIDYYFLYGPEIDTVIHEYRSMTGHSPMLPKWAYGLFQSKDRYVSLEEIQQIARRYRLEHIPLDTMVQDWFWWKTEGDPEFNSNYRDVASDLENLHKDHIHAMISVWGLLDPASETFKTLESQNLLVPNAHVYDASNPSARDIYWKRLPGKLLAQGWDAFWLDSAEPEEYWPHMGDGILRDKRLAIGNGAEYTNVFPLLHTLGVQEHWKQATDRKRVFLLTRSAFLGQQRVGATVWSGDVYSTFWGLSHQVAAGLNFALSGYPYWTTDGGGYWPPYEGSLDKPEFQELYARWYEFGAFCPVFRTHGHRPHNEIWTYDKVEPALIQYDKLRYRLMPYIYSLAWKVASEDYTMQRPLVMDWRADQKTWNIGDQFMFGPAMLVNPVLEEGAVRRSVYLPAAPAWYDFWTGEQTEGGKKIEADAPVDRTPVYVRGGSILPLGPEIEYADQNPGGPIELRIYRGADGKFDLYEDTGDSYDYERGQHTTIPMRWDDRAAVLTIGAREGTFPGMADKRVFRIVLVGNGHGTGEAVTPTADKETPYEGKEIRVRLR